MGKPEKAFMGKPEEDHGVLDGDKAECDIQISNPEIKMEETSAPVKVDGDGDAEEDEEVLKPSPTKRPRRSSSPVNVAELSLAPLPPPEASSSLTGISSSLPLSSPPSSMEATPDPTTLKLAPLPPLTSEDLHSLTTAVLQSTLACDTSHSSTNTASSVEHGASSAPTSLSSESLVRAETSPEGLPEKAGAVDDSVGAESAIPDLDLGGEFGVQEMAVFAVDNEPIAPPPKPDPKRPTGAQTATEGSSPWALQVPVPLSPKKLPSSPRSAFKPVVPPSPSSSSSQLVTLLADQASNPSIPSSFAPKTSDRPVTPPQAATIGTNSETTPPRARRSSSEPTEKGSSAAPSSLGVGGGALETVPVGRFVEAFLQAEGRSWCQRMMLMDHIEAVQEKTAAWMESLQRQIQGTYMCINYGVSRKLL